MKFLLRVKTGVNRTRVRIKHNHRVPSFTEEKLFESQGYRYVAGVDEVGRGALAGPVVAAAVILPLRTDIPWISMVKDSKLLSPKKRDILFHYIHEVAVAIGIGLAGHEVIDSKGIVPATRMAMKSAIEQLKPSPDSILIDYLRLPEVELPQKGITGGDALCYSIACASIIAKVSRDRLMIELDRTYSGYGLANHKGYCTRGHVTRLRRLGPSPIHRRSFRPVKYLI